MARLVPGWSPSAISRVVNRVTSRAPRVVPARPAPATRPPTDSIAPPICLYGSVDVPVGGEAQVPSGSISNNTGRPIEVREIRFSADGAGTNGYAQSNLCGVLMATIAIGGKVVSSDPVPLWLLGRLENAIAQAYVSGGEPATQYVWRLSRPLVLPPKCQVTVKFSHPGTVNYVITGRVALLGRFTEQASRIAAVPYVLSWRSRNVNSADGSIDDESDERALSNKLGRTIQIDRIIARHAVLNSGTGTQIVNPALIFHDGRGLAYTTGFYGAVAPVLALARLKIVTSRNWPVIASYYPIWDVFGMSGAIEIPHVMPVGDFYKAYARFALTDPDLAVQPSWSLEGAPLTYQHSIHLSLVGWREETLA